MQTITSMLRAHISIIALISVTYQVLHSQSLTTNTITRGFILDDSTRTALAYTHIFNESKRTGTISNSSGHFSMPASAGDTLVVSCIGYLSKVVFVPDTSWELTISLSQQHYEIDAVTIKAFGDYEHFKREFLALKLEETEAQRIQRNMQPLLKVAIIEAHNDRKAEQKYLTPNLGPELPMSAPILSRYEKQMLNYAEVLKREEKQRVIDKKYNRDIVKRVTKLPDNELLDFMSFCNFNSDILYHASEYEICVLIEQKFKEYLKSKLKGELQKLFPESLFWA